ncbi:glycosyltransferase family 4 protein [Nocardioides sp. Soil777]|uniref:glycosyltransferase family 4 protein n=1 Tax=Nocardioides sp. Soil777 TaxID=1736409 RepID=UPI000B238162|nr:glycosyltransferase family 1 protein [Nocardioides sp. Soil777]
MVKAWTTEFPEDEAIVAIPRHGRHSALAIEGASFVTTRLRLHPVINALELPAIARRSRVDAVLSHNFTAPFRNSGTYVYDLIFKSHPEWFSGREKVYLSTLIPLLRYASVVFTETMVEAARIRTYATKSAVVTGLGLPGLFVDAQNASETERDYVLVVGRLNVRKNLRRTLEGLLLSGMIGPDMKVLVVGKRDGVEGDYPGIVQEAMSRGEVVFTGYVSDAELKDLYVGARLFVCLTLDEGYGLPPLEALSLGVSVLASDIPVFRETLGGHAMYVDPTDTGAISRSIAPALDALRPEAMALAPTWAEVVHIIRGELSQSGGKA